MSMVAVVAYKKSQAFAIRIQYCQVAMSARFARTSLDPMWPRESGAGPSMSHVGIAFCSRPGVISENFGNQWSLSQFPLALWNKH